MRAEKAIHALLAAAAPVAALVADRIYPGQLPQGCQLPALVVEHISSTPRPTLDAASAFGLMQARIQVTALAGSYPGQKALLEVAAAACNYQRGVFNGVRVSSIVRELIGPDLRDDDRSVFYQSVDFLVIYQEP